MSSEPSIRPQVAKGAVVLWIAQLGVLLTGYAIHSGLGRFLEPAAYGTFGVAIYLGTVIGAILTAGIPLGNCGKWPSA